MSKLAGLAGGNGLVVGGGVLVGAAVIALVATGVLGPKKDAPEQPSALIQPASEAAEPEVVQAPAQTPAAPEPASDVYLPKPPSFDVVRVEPNGSTLVAGLAESNSRVAILLDGSELVSAEADNGGRFVSFVELGESASSRTLTLRMFYGDEQIDSEDQVILSATVSSTAPDAVAELSDAPAEVTAPATPSVDVATADPVDEAGAGDMLAMVAPSEATPNVEAPAPKPDVADQAAASAEAPLTADTPDATIAASDAPVATQAANAPSVQVDVAQPQIDTTTPTVLLANKDGVKVLQGGAAPAVVSDIALDAISYDDAGEVALTGRGSSEEFVRVYLDNTPITTTPVADDGSWRAQLPAEVESGVYTLRVDQVDDAGQVTSRLESPFKREDRALLAEQDTDAGGEALRAVTVQPGNTLWALARDRYGEGTLYVKLFEANKDQIRDPDLIYPGQVFAIPE